MVSNQGGKPLEVAGFTIDPASVNLLPYLFCVNNSIVILGKVDPAGTDTIHVGMANPHDLQTMEIVSRKFRDRNIEPVRITNADVTKSLSMGYQQPRIPDLVPATGQSESSPLPENLQQIESGGDRYEMIIGEDGGVSRQEESKKKKLIPDDKVVIDLVDNILLDAVKKSATDIHIENFETEVVLRYKLDGLLYQISSPLNKTNVDEFISRLKVMSNLDIAEKRLPQDGRIVLQANRGNHIMRIPFRLSILPGLFGEDAVLRVLDKSMAPVNLSELGFTQSAYDTYKKMIRNPQGLVLVTGPTGSGKTTTLYASLKEIQSSHVKILSAEDPIEYTLAGVCQKQISKYFGFAELARAFLRHDPDIMLIGEIRDEATADIAIKAAQTGHLILSTLHTNDSFGVIPRLKTLGLDPTYIAASLMGVVSMRLVRKICKYCREVYEPDQMMLDTVGDVLGKTEFLRGQGCPRCHNTGYLGRTGLFELLPIDQEMQWLIQSDTSEMDLRIHAIKTGMQLLLTDGLFKVNQDITTLEELFRVIPYRQILGQMELIKKYGKATWLEASTLV